MQTEEQQVSAFPERMCMQSVQLTENLGHVSAVETIANSKARLLS
jgi:hypothetical protein